MINMDKVQNGWISVAGKQSRGGKLLVDGKPVCDTPCRHEVAPGRHEVEVTKKGFEEYEGEVDVGRSAGDRGGRELLAQAAAQRRLVGGGDVRRCSSPAASTPAPRARA